MTVLLYSRRARVNLFPIRPPSTHICLPNHENRELNLRRKTSRGYEN